MNMVLLLHNSCISETHQMVHIKSIRATNPKKFIKEDKVIVS